jgi:hypothetical protein
MINNQIISNTPTAWLLVRLCNGIPIVGVLAHRRMGDKEYFLLLLFGRVDGDLNLNVVDLNLNRGLCGG